MYEKKKTIRSKILSAAIYALLILSVTMGTFSLYVVTRLTDDSSEKILTEICENEILKFNNELNLVRHSVDMLYSYAYDLAEYAGTDSDIYSDSYEERIKELSISIANQTEGAMAVYFRYNPLITGSGTDGFFWSRESSSDTFKEQPPTDILAYDTDDMEHVGWFYVPARTGEPLWMKPYLNQNLNVFMISYVIPFYLDNGEFVGVVGMDIDFNSILGSTGNVRIYDTGSIALADLTDRVIYSDDGTGSAHIEPLSDALYDSIAAGNTEEEILTIYGEGRDKSITCCGKLKNGMIVYVSVPFNEVTRDRNILAVTCILLTFIVFCVATFVISRRIGKIILPLKKITDVTAKYAKGDWEESYTCETRDEIQDLSSSVYTMAKNTQSYIKRLRHLARRDALTGIRNKTSYLEKVTELQNAAAPSDYAVVVMDLNLLKHVNDTYGHEAGDRLLCEAASYISKSFPNSDIFRVGGDEFTAILTGTDYRNRTELLKKFEDGMFYKIPGDEDLMVVIAFGIAAYSEDGTDYDILFQIADQRMYEKKKEMKLGRTD
ncbi:MAG: diguanylate cyclase [Clostridiales bacterium]|nr:diguanylate cyclase [Candidatus Blautia equi]